MVRAILAGTKTQTRRLVKPQPGDVHFEELPNTDPVTGWQIAGRSYRWSDDDATGRIWTPPLGQPGDQSWVKETFCYDDFGEPIYRATEPDQGCSHPEDMRPWKPSIFMPRKASRITLELTSVRVERLNDISEADAKAEGVADTFDARIASNFVGGNPGPAQMEYWALWESIHGPGSWAANPFVWVYEFKRIKP